MIVVDAEMKRRKRLLQTIPYRSQLYVMKLHMGADSMYCMLIEMYTLLEYLIMLIYKNQANQMVFHA